MDVTAWDPARYSAFRDLRLRPALDLLAQVPQVPAGGVVDLGCGDGAVAGALRLRFPGQQLTGVDSSAEMLARARGYDRLERADIAAWQPEAPPAVIFSNAALQWLDRHEQLFPRLAGMLLPGGVLAVQMPVNDLAPSHALLHSIAGEMFPDRFPAGAARVPVASARFYRDLLADMGRVTLWETEYLQELAPVSEGHPVRAFTQSTAMLRVARHLTPAELEAFVARYDAALFGAHPLLEGGGALFAFRRLFMVLQTG